MKKISLITFVIVVATSAFAVVQPTAAISVPNLPDSDGQLLSSLGDSKMDILMPTHPSKIGEDILMPTHPSKIGEDILMPTHPSKISEDILMPTHPSKIGEDILMPTHPSKISEDILMPTHPAA